MKHCPKRFRPLVADLLEGKLTPSSKDVLLRELRKNPQFADELAELYVDHLVLQVQNLPDRTDDVMQEVYSVTRWAGETRETKRTIEETQDGMGRVIEETVSVTRWVGQSAQFIRNVENALLPRQLDRQRRRSWRRILYGSAAACFAVLCIVAVVMTRSPTSTFTPLLTLGQEARAKVIRGGFTYAVTPQLEPAPGDVLQVTEGSLRLGLAGAVVELLRNSELRLPNSRRGGAPTVTRGSATVTVTAPEVDAPPFHINSADARLLVNGAATFTFANRTNGTLLRVADGKVRLESLAAANARSVVVPANHETVTRSPIAFQLRLTRTIDDAWIMDLKPMLWLDAATWETLDLDERKRVTYWHDRSPNGNTFSPPATDARPRVLSDELNGLDTVYFAAPEQILTGIRAIETASIFVVCRFQGTIPRHGGLFGTLGDFGIRHTGHRHWYGQTATSANDGDFSHRVFVNGDPAGSAAAGIPHVVAAVRDNPAKFPQPTLGSYFRHPDYGRGSRPFHGIICEVLALPEPVSADLRNRLESHLMKKWGLTTTTLP